MFQVISDCSGSGYLSLQLSRISQIAADQVISDWSGQGYLNPLFSPLSQTAVVKIISDCTYYAPGYLTLLIENSYDILHVAKWMSEYEYNVQHLNRILDNIMDGVKWKEMLTTKYI